MPLTHVVTRVLPTGDGKKLQGQLVDAYALDMPAGRLERLVDQRYLSPIPANMDPLPTVDGRFWADRSFISRYRLQEERPPRAVEVVSDPGRAPDGDEATGDEGGEGGASGPQGDVDATPAAVALAEKHGIDLTEVTGTGDGGRIKKPDVSALIDGQ